MRNNYKTLIKAFSQHYDPQDLPCILRWEAMGAKQREDETLYEYKLRLQDLLRKAYPDSDAPETLSTEIFLRGLPDKNITFLVYQQTPENLEEAYQMANSLITLRKGLGVEKKTRSVGFDVTEGESPSVRFGRNESGNRLQVIETELRNLRSDLSALLKAQRSQSPSRGGGCCHRCGDPSHFVRDCPKPPDRQSYRPSQSPNRNPPSPTRPSYPYNRDSSPNRSPNRPSYTQNYTPNSGYSQNFNKNYTPNSGYSQNFNRSPNRPNYTPNYTPNSSYSQSFTPNRSNFPYERPNSQPQAVKPDSQPFKPNSPVQTNSLGSFPNPSSPSKSNSVPNPLNH